MIFFSQEQLASNRVYWSLTVVSLVKSRIVGTVISSSISRNTGNIWIHRKKKKIQQSCDNCPIPANKCMLKVNNRNTRRSSEIFSKICVICLLLTDLLLNLFIVIQKPINLMCSYLICFQYE